MLLLAFIGQHTASPSRSDERPKQPTQVGRVLSADVVGYSRPSSACLLMLLLADRQMRVLAADGWFALTFAAPRTAGCTGTALDIGVTSARPARLAWATRSARTDGSFVFTASAGPTGNTRSALDIGVTFPRPLARAARSFVSTRSAWSTGNAKAALDIALTSAARCFMVSAELRRAWAGFARGTFS